MEDWRLKFPEIDDVDVVFGGYPRNWFDEARKIPEEKEWSHKANSLFFKGGNIDTNKDLPEDYLRAGIRMLKAVLGSFEPKHEHKEHVAGLILKSLCAKKDQS